MQALQLAMMMMMMMMMMMDDDDDDDDDVISHHVTLCPCADPLLVQFGLYS
jgi:hypothetical protein